MITLDERIAKRQRLLDRLEQDQPYLRMRIATLGSDHRRSVHSYAAEIRAQAEAELARLLEERGEESAGSFPQPAD